jgi:protein SCO1
MVWALPVTLASLCLSVGCSSPPQQPDRRSPASQAQPAASARYELKGKVVAVDKAGKKLRVDHEAIPGFMGAMTMGYAVKDAHLLENLSPGDPVTADVISSGRDLWLENIVVVRPGAQAR